MPNLGAIGSNTIFCKISLVTVPEAPISATPEDIELKQANHGTYSNPGTHVGGGGSRNKDFCTVLQTDLTRSLVLSSAQAIG